MRYFVLLPEALLVALAVAVMVAGPLGGLPATSRRWLPPAASVVVLVGLAFVYATTGTPNVSGIRAVIGNEVPALPLAIPVLLLLGGLAVRAGIAPFHVAGMQVGLGASPLGAGLIFGMGAVAAATVGIKLTAALVAVPDVYVPWVNVVSALAMVGGGASALAVHSPPPRLAYLAGSQLGWVAAGVGTHFRSGIGGSLFLLGAVALAATGGPAPLGRGGGGGPAVHRFGAGAPGRAAGAGRRPASPGRGAPPGGRFGRAGRR